MPSDSCLRLGGCNKPFGEDNMNQKNPYRLEVRTKDTDGPWKYVMDFGSENLASCCEMMKEMNRTHTSCSFRLCLITANDVFIAPQRRSKSHFEKPVNGSSTCWGIASLLNPLATR